MYVPHVSCCTNSQMASSNSDTAGCGCCCHSIHYLQHPVHLKSCPMPQDYKFLTFARIPPPPPPPWVETHALLHNAITTFTKQRAAQLSQAQHSLLASAAADLNLEWYTAMLARLHINSFRCCPCSVLVSSAAFGLVLEIAHVVGQGLFFTGLCGCCVVCMVYMVAAWSMHQRSTMSWHQLEECFG